MRQAKLEQKVNKTKTASGVQVKDTAHTPTTEGELKLTSAIFYDLEEDDYLNLLFPLVPSSMKSPVFPLVPSSSESAAPLLVPPSPMSPVSPEFLPSLPLLPPLPKSASPLALPPLVPFSPSASPMMPHYCVDLPQIFRSPATSRQVDPLAPPPATDPVTPPRPDDLSAPPQLLSN